MRGSKAWLVPLTGAGFIAMMIVGFAISSEPPDAKHPVQKIVKHYADHKDRIEAGAVVLMAATLLLVYFGSYLRMVLRRAPGEQGLLADVVFAGTVVFAVGGAIDSALSFALSEAATDIDPSAVQALQAFWDNDFLPLALGVELIVFSAGLSIVLHRSLPLWLGWVAIALGVVGLTPIGFVAFLGTGVWVLVVSVLLAVRERNQVIELPDDATALPPTQASEAEHRRARTGRLHRHGASH